MVEDIKGLIEKINEEGIKQAEEKAKAIEQEARRLAQEIIEEAKRKAASMLSETQDKLRQMSERENALRLQAARDLLISLRKEINAMLERIVVKEAQQSLKPERMADILAGLIRDFPGKPKAEIVIALKKEDLDALEKYLFRHLGAEVKKGVTLRPSEEITAGFTISFDSGKSEFDFTDKAMAEYIGNYLKPKLKDILEEATQ